MASNSNGGKNPSLQPIHHHHHHHCGGAPHHHHRHFFYLSPHCPLHRPLSQPKNHSPSCSYPAATQLNHTTQPDQIFNDAQMVEDEMQKVEDEDEDEEEGDPIFVLTDEWREFFAKSEAKRMKKQAKKGKNK